MADVFGAKKRSEVMSRIRGKDNKSTELALASAFRQSGITGWRRHLSIKLKLKLAVGPQPKPIAGAKVLIVRPDFVFRSERVAIFVDGCFWHRCPLHSQVPESNRVFWEAKLARNVERDRLVSRELKKAGWRVIRVWEHALSTNRGRATRRVVAALATRRSSDME